MVGGGEGAFIGAVHRRAAVMDGQIELTAGAFDIDPEKGRRFGVEEMYLDPARSYGSFKEMAEAEARLGSGGGAIDFVSIVTPNHVHFPVARTFLEAGFHVVCEKPMTISLDEAQQLRNIVEETGKIFCLTHTYTGYPMVKQAKHMVASGQVGEIRKIIVEYPQDWLLTRVELEGVAQAVWRTDPKQSGPAGALGDIGTHCANLVHYITGLEVMEVCAEMRTCLEGRRLDDDVNVLMKYNNGAHGILQVSQISAGEENHLTIRIYGDKCSLHWDQEHPNYLTVKTPGEPVRIYSRGQGYLCEQARLACRIPPGHPEAFIEAFANIYLGAATAIRKAESGADQPPAPDFPDVMDGVRGMAFIETVIESACSKNKWIPFEKF
ncbi:MAG: Gfo/Idh/MocA family oxidoreductase [Candidatus Glassbacteria bacterium]|nr:Gfo/Idh/MocA family oxidoreductase [Candidatus Glassbacteria bacterium]